MINESGTRAKMGPNPWRIDSVRDAWRANALPSVAELMNMSREQMYDARMGAYYYALAWAVTYYCMEGGQSKYKSTLVKYFSAVRNNFV